MTAKTFFLISVVAVCAAFGGWWAAKQSLHLHADDVFSQQGGRKIRFYQCAMHPQVKSDRPGKCPICGMELSPIYEGQGVAIENVITLDTNSISVIHVQSEVIKRQPMHRTLRVAGMMDDDETQHRVISAYNDGRIEKLFVDYIGAEVKKDDPLATFYSPNLLSAEREYLVLAQRDQTNGSSPLSDGARKMRNSAAQKLKRLGLTDVQIAALEKSTNTLMQTQIVSPMSGTVVERFVYEGQYVKEGDRLFEIANFATMWFQFDAYEGDLVWLKVGQTIEITASSAPGKIYQGKINFINPNVNDATRSAKVRVEVANPLVDENGIKRRELLHRLYAEGSLKMDFPDALIIPRSAVLNPNGEPVVYLERGGGTYEMRKIKLGILGDEGWQVLEGLKEGDHIVTSGNLLIDAQAQFNRGGTPAEHNHVKTPAVKTNLAATLSALQQQATRDFLTVADKISQGLAADNLKDFNDQAVKLNTVLPALSKAFANNADRTKLVEYIDHAGHIAKAEDLAAARKVFVPFSAATVEFVKTLRGEPMFQTVKIYKCPMANEAVPGAPKNGFWIQTNAPLHNPFFGEAMLDCGSEESL